MKTQFTKKSRSLGALVLAAVAAFQFGCSSLSEEPQLAPDNSNALVSDLISKLENYQPESDGLINARSHQAMPTFNVTLKVLQVFGFTVPAVKDKATVFVPTDEAYEAIGITPKNVSANTFNPYIIANQVVSGNMVKGKDLISSGDEFKNQMGKRLFITLDGEDLYVSDDENDLLKAKIIRTDFGAFNSVSHFIDKVLVP